MIIIILGIFIFAAVVWFIDTSNPHYIPDDLDDIFDVPSDNEKKDGNN